MRPKHQTLVDNEIDLSEFILTLWKEKFIILIITLIFIVIGYIYGTLQPKVYQTTVVLRNPPINLFEKYRPFLEQQQQTLISINFNQEFKSNLMSFDHLISFVEQNKKLDEFKSYLKTNNIVTRDYFKDKFQPITKKNVIPNQYLFTFSKPFPIENFLRDYIDYTKQITESEFKKQLKLNIEIEIEIYKHNLEIAKKINLENPIIKSFAEGNNVVVNEPSALFYKGSKVLSQKIIQFEELLKETQTIVFEYNPILESPAKPSLVTKPVTDFIAIAFALGLFLSLVFIFFRSLILKKFK